MLASVILVHRACCCTRTRAPAIVSQKGLHGICLEAIEASGKEFLKHIAFDGFEEHNISSIADGSRFRTNNQTAHRIYLSTFAPISAKNEVPGKRCIDAGIDLREVRLECLCGCPNSEISLSRQMSISRFWAVSERPSGRTKIPAGQQIASIVFFPY